jgi:hypothetical protein
MFDENSETGWADGHHHHEKIEHFDYSKVEFDRGNPIVSAIENDGADAFTLAGDGLHSIFSWVFRDGATDLQPAFLRFVAISCLLEPRWLDNESMKEIGARLGVTKASLSKVCCEFQDAFQVRFRRSRSKEARLHMAVSMRGNTNRRGKGPRRTKSVLP